MNRSAKVVLITPSPTWSLVTDPRAWLLIAVVAAVALGRSGRLPPRWLGLLKPWRRPGGGPGPRDREVTARVHPLRDPWFLFLLGLGMTAVAAWIVTSVTATARVHR